MRGFVVTIAISISVAVTVASVAVSVSVSASVPVALAVSVASATVCRAARFGWRLGARALVSFGFRRRGGCVVGFGWLVVVAAGVALATLASAFFFFAV
jgi:hypothetical protein